MCIRDRIVSTTGVGQAVGGMVGGAAIATKAVAAPATGGAVSYTHLDVYKRQVMGWMGSCIFLVVSGVVVKAFFGI